MSFESEIGKLFRDLQRTFSLVCNGSLYGGFNFFNLFESGQSALLMLRENVEFIYRLLDLTRGVVYAHGFLSIKR